MAEAMHRLEPIVPSEEALWSETFATARQPNEFLKPQDRRRGAESGVAGARQGERTGSEIACIILARVRKEKGAAMIKKAKGG